MVPEKLRFCLKTPIWALVGNAPNCKVDDRSKVVGGAQRIETPDGYVFPLSIESGLVYMHSIQVPTDDDLQQYPHVFFTSLDIGMLLFWIMVLPLHFFMKSITKWMIHHFRILFLMNLETFNNKWYSTWICSGIQDHQRLGSILFMHTFMKATLLNKTGNH